MQARRPSGLTPLSIVLPRPSLPRRRSSLLSLVPSPRTPRSCGSPTCPSILYAGAGNRKSTDSWNSSNQDLEDLDYDWKQDQILFLRRTLDALPPHLVTPFNGPIPPSNLLDKIARGVAQAKGEDWPHSLRATRVKLIEIARAIAEEDSKPRKTIPEENDMDTSDYPTFTEGEVLQQTTNIGTGKSGLGIGIGLGARRPLYRQSSMDFLNTSDIQDDSINRLSKRLQKADRFIPNASYHPYSRSQNRRSLESSSHVPSLISPSTPSTTTLSSLASISAAGAHTRVLRRSVSITSSSSTNSSSRMSLGSANGLSSMAADPRVQRVRRSESFCVPIQDSVSSRRAVKRAPSYGTLAQESRGKTGDIDLTLPDPSSDEEEKARTRRAKKPRMRSTSGGTPPLSPTPEPDSPPVTLSPASPRAKNTKSAVSPGQAGPSKRTTKKTKAAVQAPEFQTISADPTPKRLKRSASMFGAELPRAGSSLQYPETPVAKPFLSAAPLLAPAPGPEKVKTLRRVRRLPPARRISFGSLVAPVGEDGHEADMEECDEERLGSAFQLR